MPHCAEQLRQRTVRVAQLRFGKLVIEPVGPVHYDAVYAVTFKTPDFIGNGKCLPDALIGGTQLTEAHLEPDFCRDGGLLLRFVRLDGGDRVVAMRARLRPEAGEGRTGRCYVQATVLQTTTANGWAGMPAGFPAWCADGLFAEPDIFSVPLAERLPRPAVDLDPDDAPAPTLTEIAALRGCRRARIASIARAMIEGTPLIVGCDAFDLNEPGPEQTHARTKLFLADVGRAFSFLAVNGIEVASDLVVAAGFMPEVQPGGVRLLLSQRSTPVLDQDHLGLQAALVRHAPIEASRSVSLVPELGLPAPDAGSQSGAVRPNPVHAQQADIERKYSNPGVAPKARPGTATGISRDPQGMQPTRTQK